ncbi:septal ring lytic transglycosylase RlpA family protein [Ramlibacter rhizophilus]|uniref:Endolytic peptidoglycan transglycosylase RlpA n=1 Tax=Ramlibacter rhizophilus TaxID=1781167 RepID=A0A4Z0BGC6_9BURK|nr:septal ring lytic transglycosylase RlpA family protein [Ramlibacter rhizophilus]TFY97791.1 septal ring lytic transglycosylase RlpA family protein [Ramlibacter rhizophilus]
MALTHRRVLPALIAFGVCLSLATPALAESRASEAAASREADAQPTPKSGTDHTGKPRVGKASFYHDRFVGRKMANGKPMRAEDDNAASLTLPLGTTARVTNLETGQSTVVTIEDRGPYVDGRIVDLSPSSAEAIGLTREQGLAPVEVAPIEVPLPDGTVKMGAGAAN